MPSLEISEDIAISFKQLVLINHPPMSVSQCWGSVTFWCGSGSSDLYQVPLTYGYGSGSDSFLPCFKDANKKNFSPFFFFFPNPDPYLWLMDPDPGGPKTCWSGSGSESPTLLLVFYYSLYSIRYVFIVSFCLLWTTAVRTPIVIPVLWVISCRFPWWR
jgi:hypothetical protein